PGDLRLPHVDPHRDFSPAILERTSDYVAFLRVLFIGSAVALIGVLWIYARKGARFARESAAGRIGTGMLLGMLGLGFVWLAELPFGVAGLWWERRHHISKQGYLEVIVNSFLGLGSQFVFVCVAIGIVMGLAAVLKQWWWIAGAPVLVGLAFLSAFLQPYLIPGLHPLHNKAVEA